jgi:hypothetical protein
MLSKFRWLILILLLASLTSCATSASPTPITTAVAPTSGPTPIPTSTPPSTVAAVTPSSVFTATVAAAGTGAHVPNSCTALVSLVDTYIGGVATTKSLGSPQHLSCEFANANASNIIIVNIGVGGTATSFDALKSTSAKGGRTVTSITGLGTSAFSVSKNNVPAGISVLTAEGLVYVVNSNLSIAQDQSLIEQLMKLP